VESFKTSAPSGRFVPLTVLLILELELEELLLLELELELEPNRLVSSSAAFEEVGTDRAFVSLHVLCTGPPASLLISSGSSLIVDSSLVSEFLIVSEAEVAELAIGTVESSANVSRVFAL